jgi:RNA polymerase sigma-70 factor (ECF subfamily)
MMVIAMDEAALIKEAQRGDLDSFNSLVLTYQSLVFNVAFRIMGEPDSSADATQEAFISAFKHLKSFRGGSFRSWLLRIVTNACYDELRRRKRRPSSSLEELTEFSNGHDSQEPDNLGSHIISPEKETENIELSAAIQDCINRLSAEFKTVVVLVDIQGYDYQEVSDVIERPIGTVKSRLARARLKLRDCLQRYRELLPASFRYEDEAMV